MPENTQNKKRNPTRVQGSRMGKQGRLTSQGTTSRSVTARITEPTKPTILENKGITTENIEKGDWIVEYYNNGNIKTIMERPETYEFDTRTKYKGQTRTYSPTIVTFNENGTLKKEETYTKVKDGKRTNPEKTSEKIYDNGRLISEKSWGIDRTKSGGFQGMKEAKNLTYDKEGRPTGTIRELTSKGDVRAVTNIRNGEGTTRELGTSKDFYNEKQEEEYRKQQKERVQKTLDRGQFKYVEGSSKKATPQEMAMFRKESILPRSNKELKYTKPDGTKVYGVEGIFTKTPEGSTQIFKDKAPLPTYTQTAYDKKMTREANIEYERAMEGRQAMYELAGYQPTSYNPYGNMSIGEEYKAKDKYATTRYTREDKGGEKDGDLQSIRDDNNFINYITNTIPSKETEKQSFKQKVKKEVKELGGWRNYAIEVLKVPAHFLYSTAKGTVKITPIGMTYMMSRNNRKIIEAYRNKDYKEAKKLQKEQEY